MSEFIIRRGDLTFTPSKYQEDILRFAKYGTGNAYIEACAGASKTTMLENMLYYLPDNEKKLFIAFNKSIADEMKSRVCGVNNVKVTTYHSLGYSILRENFPNKTFVVDEDKYVKYLRENINLLTGFNEIETLGVNRNSYINNIIHLIEYARYYRKSHPIHIKTIANQYNLNLFRDETTVVKKILEWGKNNLETIDYTDMVWLTGEFNLTTKKHLYDNILIDEAQDTSIMQQEMIERCLKRGTRMFIVGDIKQSINVWCGSDINAIKKFQNETCETFTLPISYRCPKKVVELAKQYSPNIEASENAIEGEIRYNVPDSMPNGNDMVLCRNTAPLITLYLKYLRNNKKCFIKGYEGISNKYINYILESGAIYIDKECETTDGLIPKMYEKLIFNVNNLIKNNYIIEEAYHHPTTINMYDDIMGIIALSDNIFKTEDLIEKIKAIFNESSCEGVILTTVHKAKGLEADNVFIYYPSLLPSKFAKKEWEIIAEEHLTYVAYTRAKKTLNFIEENTKNYKIGATFNYEQMVKNIEKIKKKMNLFQNENVTTEKTNIGTTSINSITNKKKNNIFL